MIVLKEKNMVNNINPDYKELILHALNYHFPGAKVYLFGSRARGTNLSGADIDVAVDAGQPISFGEMERARVTLEHLPIPVNMDLVDLHSIPPEFKQTILQEGIAWKS